MALGRVHVRSPFRSGGDVVNEAVAPPPLSNAAVLVALADVADPEIPAISIVDLGIVHRAVVVEDGRIEVQLLPTFVGCPAIEAIRHAVSERLATSAGRSREHLIRGPVDVRADHAPGGVNCVIWGFAPPSEPADVLCPYCASANVAMDSPFGPTLCRSLFYCRACRQPFEAFKAV